MKRTGFKPFKPKPGVKYMYGSTFKVNPNTKPLKRSTLRPVAKKTASLWAKARKECLERYPVCVLCGKKAEHCHHWQYCRSQRPDLKYNQDNLVMLCAKCHNHNGPDKRFYELKEQIEQKQKGK